jgi:regulator of protease activity HflC (stomatin/prohibitin superfamily)
MKKFALSSIVVAVLVWVSGCAQLRPGQDPLVVRAEQVEATAKATFDLVLNIDHSDRGFWRTNAPAFHSFCEWLRQPQIVWVTNVLPRASAMIANLDNVKQDYVWARQGSNALITALVVLQSASTEAGGWVQVVTNNNANR